VNDLPPSNEPGLTRYLNHVLVFILAVAAVSTAVVLLTYRHYFSGPISHDNELWAHFGDFVGGSLGPLLSFFSLVALLVALMVQTHQSSLSSRELADAARVLKLQSDSLKLQTFERTLFELLKLYDESVRAIDLRREGKVTATGRDCFAVFYFRLDTEFKETIRNRPDLQPCALIEESYTAFFRQEQQDVGHCFRTLYHIFKFISESDVPDRKRYASIVRAQLSSYELALLFYNGLHSVGVKFKPLIERYAIFENSDPDLLFSPEHLRLYELSAFGDHDISAYMLS
jgi:hypothetical protein